MLILQNPFWEDKMKKTKRIKFLIPLFFFAAFLLWTVLSRFVDRMPIGPEESVVGFSTLNEIFHKFTGVNLFLYEITDLLSLIPLGFAFGFALLGLIQWIGRKKLLLVDRDILFLGIYFAVVLSVFFFFEFFPINYRPVLLEGVLEVSYPSSTTMLSLCVLGSTATMLKARISAPLPRRAITVFLWVFAGFMVTARAFSGVHWLGDIVGGILISLSLISAFRNSLLFLE